MAAERFGRIGSGVAVVVLTVAARLRPLANADLLWQIASGEVIRAARGRLTVDVFSASLLGAPLHDHEPAWEVLVSALHRGVGFAGLWWLTLVTMVVAALVADCVASRIVPSAAARVAAFALVYVAVHARLDLRAEWVPFAAIAVAHAVRTRGERPVHVAAPIAIAAIAAPFHALALAVAVVPIAHWLAHRRRRDALVAAGVIAIVVAVSPASLLSVIDHLRAHTFSAHIVEYYSPWRIVAGGDASPLIALTLAVVAMAGLGRGPSAILIALLVLPGLLRVRFTTMCLLAALPWVVAGVAAVLDRALARIRVRAAVSTLVAGIAITVMTRDAGRQPMVGFDWSDQPVDAVAHLPPGARLFHPFNFGAYLIYARVPVVIDPRAATLYPEPYAGTYYEALADEAHFATFLARFDTVLLHRRHRGTAQLRAFLYRDPRFVVIWEDQTAVVFGRVNAPR